jgi:hypothetical protein
VKCGANFLRAAGSKIADFYFAAPAREKKFVSPAIVVCATLQEWFPPLGFISPATARLAVTTMFSRPDVLRQQ